MWGGRTTSFEVVDRKSLKEEGECGEGWDEALVYLPIIGDPWESNFFGVERQRESGSQKNEVRKWQLLI